MSRRPWMPLYIADYLADTSHLTAAQHGAYLLLLMHYWKTGGLPDNDAQLARVARMSDHEWSTTRPVVRAFFQDGWFHKRVDDELKEAEAAYGRRAAAGRRGGMAKGQSLTQPKPSNAEALLKQSPSQSEEEGGGGARAREAAGLISNEAMALADDLAVIAGHDPTFLPPGWHGAAYRVQTWLGAGWTREIILIGAKAAMASKRDGPPSSVRYFEKPIDRERVHQQAKIPSSNGVREACHAETSNIIVAADRLIERIRGFDQPAPAIGEPARIRSGTGEVTVRALSKR